MATTLADLRAELAARGYDYVSTARANRWLNSANATVEEEERWPFRLTTSTGAAPLTIATLGDILSVTDTVQNNATLAEMTEHELVDFVNLTQTGSPSHYYVDLTTVRVWPVSTNTISVRHFSTATALAADGDNIRIPDRFADAIVHYAIAAFAAPDKDNSDAMAVASAAYDSMLVTMREQLLIRPPHIRRTPGASEDGL